MLASSFNRRRFLYSLGAGLAGGALLSACVRTAQGSAKPQNMLVYVGCYGAADQDNIFLCRLSLATGALTQLAALRGNDNPSYLALTADHRFLYAVNETETYQGQKSGSVSSFAVEPTSGQLRLLSQQASGGPIPCYISLDAPRRQALVANYGDGTVSLLPLQPDGRLLPPATRLHPGQPGPHKNQANARAHCFLPGPTGQHYFAVDLGLDTVFRYSAAGGPAGAAVLSTGQVAYKAKPGAGPRHLTFHPTRPLAYLINELDSTMTALAYDARQGTLTEIETVPCLPAGFTEWNACADVHISPNGRFLYGSNRGHNSLVVFAIDQKTGRLTLVEHVLLPGKTPRNFTFDPTGRLVLVALQQSDSVVTYFADAQTGRLTPTGAPSLSCPAPVCLRVLPDFIKG